MLEKVGEKGQQNLKTSSVLIVGAGGLGAPVLQYLTASGVGNLAIMDDGLVTEDNLHRQILYGGHDLGKLKTIIARERLKILNPFVKFELINIRLDESNAENIISRFDIVIDATDNYKTRYIIDSNCRKIGIPWVFGSIYKYEGQVSVFNYKNQFKLKDLYSGVEDLKNIPDPDKQGLLGILPGIVGSFQANEAIKILSGIGDVLSGKLLSYNMLSGETTLISLT